MLTRRLWAAGLILFGAALQAPVQAQWIGYPTPGAPRTANGKVNLSGPAPKYIDGKVDLSGTWEADAGFFTDLTQDLKPGEVEMLPWAKAVQQDRELSDHQNDLLSECMPPGVPRINTSSATMPHPFKVVQTPTLVVLLYETSANQTFRQVFLDGRKLPNDPQPSWLGYSVGRYENNGASLVVETTGFNGLAWLDTAKGHPQTDTAKVTERFSRPDFGHLLIDVTIDDAKAYTKIWNARIKVHMLPDADLIETFCENEKDHGHKHF